MINNIWENEIDPGFRRRAKIITTRSSELWGNKNKTVSILDIGCGRGWYENMLTRVLKRYRIVAVDGNTEYLSSAKQRSGHKSVSFLKGDATNLNFKDNSFDGVICSEVLEHITEDGMAISEIRRVLKPKGTALISVPCKNYPFFWDPVNWILEKFFGRHLPANIWWISGIWADHVRLYDENDLLVKFKRNHLKIIRVWRSTHYCLPFAHFLLYGVGKNIVEMGWFKEFNRFNFESKPGILFKFIKNIFDIFDKKNEGFEITKDDSCLNLIIEVRK